MKAQISLSRRELLFATRSAHKTPDASDLVAEIASHCLALNAVDCRLCDDSCEPRAIRFRPRLGGQFVPEIEAGSCTGCGDCLTVCPKGALSLVEKLDHDG